MRLLKHVLLLFLLVCCAHLLRANHILGGNIAWGCLGGNQYGITLTIYKDCFGSTPATTEETIFLFPSGASCSAIPFSADAPFVSEIEISDLCASELMNSSCNGGLTPGTTQLTYYVVVTLDPTCTWSVEWGAGDWNYFVNLDTGVLPGAYFQTVVDPAIGCNQSVQITSLQVPYYCVADVVSQQITVDNPQGYTLNYSFTSVLTDFGLDAPYEAGFTPTLPIPGIAIDPLTGLITFTAPAQFGNYVVGVQVDMFDAMGNLVGNMLESMTFVIQPCATTSTDFTAPGIIANNAESTLINGTTISVCAGELLCFTVEATNINNFRVITLTSDFETVFPTGTFIQTDTNPAGGESCVMTDASMVGSYIIHFEADDDACDFPGHDELDITVIVEPNLVVDITDALICTGDVLAVNATGAASYNWNIVSGDADPDFSCTNCGNQTLSPDQNTIIEIVAVGAPLQCNYRDTLNVVVSLGEFSAVLNNETCNGNDGSIDLTVLSGTGLYSFAWDTPSFTEDQTGLQGGTYCVAVSDLGLPGCTADSCFILTSDPPLSGSISGSITICEGASADILFDLNGTGPFTISMTPAGPATAIDGAIFTVTPATTTIYTLNSITDSNVPSCVYAIPSSVTITVRSLVNASFLPAGPVCEGDVVTLTFDIDQPGTYNIGYSIDGIAQPITSATDGTTLNFSPVDDVSYTITSVSYQTLPNCPNALNNQIDVLVNDVPDAVLTGGNEICAGDNLDLTINLAGTGPWVVDYTANGTAQPVLNIAATPFTWNLAPVITTNYCLTNVTDEGVNCSQVINSCQTITVEPVPDATISGDITICPGASTNLLIDLISVPGLYNVVLQETDSGGSTTINLTNLTDPFNYNVSPDENTTYTLVSVEYSNNPGDCVTNIGEDVMVTLTTEISAIVLDTLCTPNGQNYQITFQLTGGDVTTFSAIALSGTPGSFAGAIFTSGLVPTGTGDTWTFNDQYNCNPYVISVAPYSCPIVTWAGTMQQDTLIICGNAPAIGVWNNDGIFDFDDQLMFVLHDSSDDNIGFIYASDCDDSGFNDPDNPLVFGNGAGEIQYGVVYYISAVVGDDDGSGDCVDLTAPFVSVAIGQPVVWFELPSATMSGGGAVCIGNSVDVQIDFTGQATWTIQYSIDGIVQPVVITSSNPYLFSTSTDGLYVLTSVNTFGCGGAVAGDADVIINPLPSATIIAGGETCEGIPFDFEITLTGTPNWSFDVVYDDGVNATVTTTLSGITSSPATYSSPGAGTYYIANLTDGNGCDGAGNSASVVLTVNTLPTAQFAFSDTSFCEGLSLDLIIDLFGESDWDITYNVDGGPAQTWNATTDPFTQNITVGGTYTITAVLDNNGCTQNFAESITVIEIVTPIADAGADIEVCSGADLMIGTPAVAGQTYEWNPETGLNDITLAQPTANVSNAGVMDQIIIYTVTAFNSQCLTTDDISLTVHPVPLVDAGANDTICFAQTIQLNATGGNSYLWTDNGYFLDPLTSPSPNVAPDVSSWFVVTGFDALLCSAQDSVFITVPEEFLVTEDFSSSVCFNTCDGFITLAPEGGFIPYYLVWQGGVLDSIAETELCAGTFNYNVTDDFGCVVAGIIDIAQQPDYFIDDVIITPAQCFGDNNGQIEIVETTAVDYELVQTSEVNQTGLFIDLVAGTYDFIVYDVLGCPADTTVSFVENSSIIDIVPGFVSQLVCYLDTVSFYASAVGGAGIFTYNWYNCAGALVNCFVATGDSIQVTITQDTTLYVIATDMNGCNSDTLDLTVYFNPEILLSISPDSVGFICEFDCVSLEAGAAGGNGSIGVAWYQDDPGGPILLANAYNTIQCPLVNTTYFAIADDGCNPPITDTIFVTVYDTPEAIIDASIFEGCYPTTVEFLNLTNSTLSELCVWNLGDGSTLAICDDFEYIYAAEGEYFPWISVTSADGCTNIDSLDVPIIIHGYPVPEFTWEPQPVTILENEVQFFNLSTGEISWEWDFAGLGSSTIEHPQFLFPDLDLFGFPVCLVVTNEFDCSDTVCYSILMESIVLVWVPNSFTPDGDGRNEVFLPVVRGYDPATYKFMIYDRWGVQIFYTEDPEEPWLGELHSGEYYVQNDTYVWRIELKDLMTSEERAFMGHVTIIR
ncbi:MAG: gliding motility-associated C-terminal domain-containing protein [Flavobacteriales bacterium]|nr:gliding motility-associated C-terminal domain-containing protein [Flavobacteriales bacterium]